MGKSGAGIGQIVGGVIGFLVTGGSFGGMMIGMSIGGMAGGIISPTKNQSADIPPMAGYPIQRSNKGSPVPKVYGTDRLAGNIIWMGKAHPWQKKEKQGGKGGGGQSVVTGQGCRRSFLIGIAEGPATIIRMWKGKEEVAITKATTFVGYDNTGIAALTGEDYSDYKNLCCAFFNEYEVGGTGAIPNFTFEVTSGTQPFFTGRYIWPAVKDVLQVLGTDGDFSGNFNGGTGGWGEETGVCLEKAWDMAHTSDGGMIVVTEGGGSVWPVVKLKYDGTIDTDWGTNGYWKPPLASQWSKPRCVCVSKTGKIFIGGKAGATYGWDNLCKLNSDGSLDTRFNEGALFGPIPGAVGYISSYRDYPNNIHKIQLNSNETKLFLFSDWCTHYQTHDTPTHPFLPVINEHFQYNITAINPLDGSIYDGQHNETFGPDDLPVLETEWGYYGHHKITEDSTQDACCGEVLSDDTIIMAQVDYWNKGSLFKIDADGSNDWVKKLMIPGHAFIPRSRDYSAGYSMFVENDESVWILYFLIGETNSYLKHYSKAGVLLDSLQWPDVSAYCVIVIGNYIYIGSDTNWCGTATPQIHQFLRDGTKIDTFAPSVINGYVTFLIPTHKGANDLPPGTIIKDLLTNNIYGAGIDESTYIDTASFEDVDWYAAGLDLAFSFVIGQQKPVLDWIDYINSHFQGYLYMSEGKIHLGVLKEESNAFTLTRSNLVVEEGENPPPPVRIRKQERGNTANRIEVSWSNRDKNYDISVALAMDEVDQRVSDKVRKQTIQLTGIKNADLSQKMAYKLLFNSMYRFSHYSFIVSYKSMLFEVGDVGTITDGFLLTDEKIRITNIEEDKDGRGLTIQAVEDTEFIYDEFLYQTQESERTPDADDAPTLVDASATMTESPTDRGLGISIVPGGEDTNGWYIYRSFDDVSYELLGVATIVDVTDFDTNSTGVLTSKLPSHKAGSVYTGDESFLVNIGTVTDLDTAITDDVFFNKGRLAKIGDEIISYKSCVETSVSGIWKITGLIRGLYGTEPVAHNVDDVFWTINIDYSYGYAESDVGRTAYFKFLTFYGNSIQNLADVSAISHVIKGRYIQPLPVSLPRINGREGLVTYKTTDLYIDFYFCSKLSGFGRGGYGNALWGAYAKDPNLERLKVEIVEEDGTAITDATYLLSDFADPPQLKILEADRAGKNPIVVKLTPASNILSDETRQLTAEKI